MHSVKLVQESKAKPGSQVFTSSGVFTVPKGIKQIEVFCVGGGSAGASSNFGSGDYASGGGGGGGYTTTQKVSVFKGQSVNISIGAGGAQYKSGNATAVDSVSAAGGQIGGYRGGLTYTNVRGGNGGSGGGTGGSYSADDSVWCVSANGGSDGNDGDSVYLPHSWKWLDSGTGQHSTTRAFGEAGGTLYAGGGGGGWGGCGIGIGQGGAGGGGGGAISDPTNNLTAVSHPGATNTGGGGGGAPCNASGKFHGVGGSGIAIIRW